MKAIKAILQMEYERNLRGQNQLYLYCN